MKSILSSLIQNFLAETRSLTEDEQYVLNFASEIVQGKVSSMPHFALCYDNESMLYIFIKLYGNGCIDANILDETEVCKYLSIEYDNDGIYHFGSNSYIYFADIPLEQENLKWIDWHLNKNKKH